MRLAPLALLVALAGTTTRAQTQDLAARIAAAPDGTVRLAFTARPDVCGNGHSHTYYSSSDDVQWADDCQHGPVRVVLEVRDHAPTTVHTYVGGHWRPVPVGGRVVTDLGMVSAPEAAVYLVGLADRLPGSAGGEAIMPATLADSATIWPQLVALARNTGRPTRTREQAVFWLGQAASDVSASLDSIVGDERQDDDIREKAIFALSQRPRDEGVPALIRIAKTNPDPALRKKALFWLGQSGDPRAIDLFEQILTDHR